MIPLISPFNSFRLHHTLEILNQYEASKLKNVPLDNLISKYFRNNRSLGSKDRKQVGDVAFGTVRWMLLLDHLLEDSEKSWINRVRKYISTEMSQVENEHKDIPANVQVSFPEYLFERITSSFDQEIAKKICKVSNTRAPVTVRANVLKTSRDELMSKLSSRYKVTPTEYSTNGITFSKRTWFSSMEEYKEGLFEPQDEGSQLVAELVKPLPGQNVLDYCAGAGGKTLAFVSSMKNKGNIYVHDINVHLLRSECIKRLQKAGITNAHILLPSQHRELNSLKKSMDWIVLDVPCSGTGTLRRHPETKYAINKEVLEARIAEQRKIFDRALTFLKKGGKIVYITCSILKEENEEQMEYFLDKYGLKVEGQIFKSIPTENGMDGFFGFVAT